MQLLTASLNKLQIQNLGRRWEQYVSTRKQILIVFLHRRGYQKGIEVNKIVCGYNTYLYVGIITVFLFHNEAVILPIQI